MFSCSPSPPSTFFPLLFPYLSSSLPFHVLPFLFFTFSHPSFPLLSSSLPFLFLFCLVVNQSFFTINFSDFTRSVSPPFLSLILLLSLSSCLRSFLPATPPSPPTLSSSPHHSLPPPPTPHQSLPLFYFWNQCFGKICVTHLKINIGVCGLARWGGGC